MPVVQRMFWRAAAILITTFWLVMTVLLVRVTYFPESTFFAEVPLRLVLKRFLEQAATPNGLHLYHGDTKAGHLTCTSILRRESSSGGDHVLMINGRLDEGIIKSVEGVITFDLKITILDAQRWAGALGVIRIPSQHMIVNFNWRPGEPVPDFSVHQNGVLLTDDAAVRPIIAQMLGGPAPGAVPTDDLFTIKTREGSLKLAGQKRNGYLLAIGMMDRIQIRAFFTEIGELALVELPDGWRALEPMIHGLVPDEPET